jgi:hypothetical protein
MRLPIDTQHLNFIAVGIPEAVVDFDTKAPRHDPDGRALHSLSIVAIGGEGADILIVKVAGLPKGITAGSPVRVCSLVATTWQMKDRNGVSFRAESIESLGASVTPSKSSAAT